MQTSPNTAMAATPGTNYSGLANLMAMQGTGGDNTLVHMSKSELPYLNNLARAAGHPQGLPINPKTGLPEANILKTILPVAGAILGGMFFPPALLGLGAGSALATGIGAGLGSFTGSMFAGKSFKDAAIGGLLSGGLSGLSAGMFGGQSLMGDPSTLATTGVAEQATIASGLDSFVEGTVDAGTIGSNTASSALRGIPSGIPSSSPGLGSPMPGTASTPMFADTTGGGYGLAKESLSNNLPARLFPSGMGNPTPSNYRELGMGTSTNIPSQAFKNIDARIASEAATKPLNSLPQVQTAAPPSFFKSSPVMSSRIPVSNIQGNLPKGLELSPEIGADISRSSARNIMNLPKEPGYTDLSVLNKFDPETMSAMNFMKYASNPMIGKAGVLTGIDALTGQGAFEPIDYSGYPTGEENKPSPLPLKGLKFESERTGAFPTTEEQALAFAQPGGGRQRFFNQRFTIPARTGGGIAALIR